MTEILWHGRGGQGAFTAARLLGTAFSLEQENYSLAFPSFGPERRGAPIRAFTKLDNKPIVNRSEIQKADYNIYLDDTVFSLEEAFSQIKNEGKIILNTSKKIKNPQIISFDAEIIVQEILGMPIVNTAVLAVFGAVTGIISFDSLEKAIHIGMQPKIAEKNIFLITKVYEQIKEKGYK